MQRCVVFALRVSVKCQLGVGVGVLPRSRFLGSRITLLTPLKMTAWEARVGVPFCFVLVCFFVLFFVGLVWFLFCLFFQRLLLQENRNKKQTNKRKKKQNKTKRTKSTPLLLKLEGNQKQSKGRVNVDYRRQQFNSKTIDGFINAPRKS